jgi:hypothetical protein
VNQLGVKLEQVNGKELRIKTQIQNMKEVYVDYTTIFPWELLHATSTIQRSPDT